MIQIAVNDPYRAARKFATDRGYVLMAVDYDPHGYSVTLHPVEWTDGQYISGPAYRTRETLRAKAPTILEAVARAIGAPVP